MKKISFFLLSLPALFMLSCSNNSNTETENKDKNILVERIQYDVFIKSPNADYDWWRENIEGSKRENFVKTILDLAYTGKVKAYDYDNTPLTPEQAKGILNKVDTISIQDPNNTNVYKDTVIKNITDIKEISKVRFLEEWSYDDKKLSFNKKVCGVMLMRENYDDSLNLRGYSPTFWIYFDKDYPAKLK
ncbi:MAG TPA: hypothetical protein PKK00_09205 [Bacteroidales bacterium]|nr:hypothetical protein [Bacteroidales bacterium]HPS17069.1 hypothetical protein [Bacteroidales bacterium]